MRSPWRGSFAGELGGLHTDIIRGGGEGGAPLTRVTPAFVERDAVTAGRMIAADEAINERRIKIGLDALTLIATQQPMARDLRLIAAIMEIVGELERIHDYIKGIGKISLSVGATPILPTIAAHMPEMAETAREMLHLSLKAFAERDKELALRVPAMDDKVDFLFNHLYSDVVAYVMEHPLETAHANHLEWALHNLERSADRTINICEWVVYMVTGVYREMSMGEYESPPA